MEEGQDALAHLRAGGRGLGADGLVLAEEGVVGVGAGPVGEDELREELGEVGVHPDAVHEVAAPRLAYPGVGDELLDPEGLGLAALPHDRLDGDELALEEEPARPVGRRDVVGARLDHLALEVAEGHVYPQEEEVDRVLHLVQPVEASA